MSEIFPGEYDCQAVRLYIVLLNLRDHPRPLKPQYPTGIRLWQDPVLAINPDPGLCTSNAGKFLSLLNEYFRYKSLLFVFVSDVP